MLKDLEKKMSELPEIRYLESKNGDYKIVGGEDRLNLMIFLDKSEENKKNGGLGFIVSEKGGVMKINSAGEKYLSKNILPLIMDSVPASQTERYENKLIGKGQRNDFTENGPVPGIKHSPSVMEQNYFGLTPSYVEEPTPDEFFTGPRGETMELDKNGMPSMDTFKFVTRHYNNRVSHFK